MSTNALSAYRRIRAVAIARRGGVRLSFAECAAIYWGDTAVRDAIDNALEAEKNTGAAKRAAQKASAK